MRNYKYLVDYYQPLGRVLREQGSTVKEHIKPFKKFLKDNDMIHMIHYENCQVISFKLKQDMHLFLLVFGNYFRVR